LRFGKNGTLVSLPASGKAQKGNKFFVVLLMKQAFLLWDMEHWWGGLHNAYLGIWKGGGDPWN